MADSSDEDNNINEEPEESVAEPDQSKSFSSRISSFLLMVFGFLLYLYVLYCLYRTLVIPASVSSISQHPINVTRTNHTKDDNEALYVGTMLLRNGGLMLLFLLQHSFFPRAIVERCLSSCNLSPFVRAIYVFNTCIVLQVINFFWMPVRPEYHLWNCTHDSSLFFVVMVTVHSLCWLSVGFSLFVFDYLRLFGIKQLYYYYYLGVRENPAANTANRDLLSNMSHPVFLAPLVLLWGVPFMTYDRLLVGVMVPTYLLWGSRISNEDNTYVREMFRRKKQLLFKKTN